MARVAAYEETPEGRARNRIFELQLQEFGRGFGAAQQHELDSLRTLYPDLPLDPSDPLKEIMEAFAAVRQQSSATSG
jgi:hypothetical protein